MSDLMDHMHQPTSVADLMRMMSVLADEMIRVRDRFETVTEGVPNKLAYVAYEASRATGEERGPKLSKIQDPMESAFRDASWALKDAAEAFAHVDSEMRRVGLPREARW